MARSSSVVIIAILILAVAPLLAQTPGKDPVSSIQDNSFLLEEAYNQEDDVIQHISFFMRNRANDDWIYTFTEEIPAGGQKHQLSFTLPGMRLEGETGLGDVAVNYRYQLTGDGTRPLAVAPRLSVVLPSGSSKKGHGAGSAGLQFNLPASYVLAPRVAGHSNAGVTWSGGAQDGADRKADLWTVSAGQSFIYAWSDRFHLMLEATFTRAQQETGTGLTTAEDSMLVGPAIRWAHNFPSGLQIVPGIGIPFGVGSSAGERSVLLYVSFEHPFAAASRR